MKLRGQIRTTVVLGLILTVTFLLPVLLKAEVPHQISYQGYLTDDLGNPLDGEYWMLFSIYDMPTGGTALWYENPHIRVTNGVYNIHLGLNPIGNPFPDDLFDGELWLGVAVESDPEMIPRQLLTSTPFAKRAEVAEHVENGAIETIHLANDAVTGDKIDNGAVSSSHLKDGTAISEILDDDGAGSGLDADTLDGLQASSFVSTGSDYGRIGVATNLYEGSTTMTDKYINQNGDEMIGRFGATVTPFASGWFEAIKGSLIGGEAGAGVYGYATGNSTYGVRGVATGDEGVGVYGEATSTLWDITKTSYGGYFIAASQEGIGVYGEGKDVGVYGTDGVDAFGGVGVYGVARGGAGVGVQGRATDDGYNKNYGGYFSGAGEKGRGVYGTASRYGVEGRAYEDGDVANFGGYFEADGNFGVGVFGQSPNYGVHGIAYSSEGQGVFGEATGYDGLGVKGLSFGDSGIGVYGEARGKYGRAFEGVANGTTGTNHGGYFEAHGLTGRGVFGRAFGSSGTGVKGMGEAYDFYADGPGQDYGYASSIRWKQSIEEIDGALEMVMQMRGVYFDWDGEHGGHHDLGFIAEEVGQHVPEIVVYEDDGKYASGMDYGKMTPILLQAIKEQQGIISELRVEIDTLKDEIKAIKAIK